LSVIRESEAGQNNSYSQDSAAVAENNIQEVQNQEEIHLKLQLLNHPRCQKLLYGDDQYTVSNRGCSILQNRLETLESGKKIVTNRSDAYLKQKVHDFKNFLKEFEELLSSEQLFSPTKPSATHHKRINSCDSQRLNNGEAKILDTILDKYFAGPGPVSGTTTANVTEAATLTVTNHQQQATQEEEIQPSVEAPVEDAVNNEQQPPVKEKKLKKKRSLGPGEKKTKKQPKVILNTSNLSSTTDLVSHTNSVSSPVQAQKANPSPLDKILSGSSSLTFKHLDMITNPNVNKLGLSSVKSDSNINYESTLKDTRKNSEVSSHIADTAFGSPTADVIVDYSQFSKFTKNPRSVSFASAKSSSMKTLPEHQVEILENKPAKTLTKSKTTASKSKITAKSSPKKSVATASKPRSNSKKDSKSATLTNSGKFDVLSLLKPTTKKAKF